MYGSRRKNLDERLMKSQEFESLGVAYQRHGEVNSLL